MVSLEWGMKIDDVNKCAEKKLKKTTLHKNLGRR